MFFKSFEYLKDIEKLISESYDLPIFKGYKAVNKRGVEKLIDEIYANLPVDVQQARKYLRDRQIRVESSNNGEIYDNLKDLEIGLDNSMSFSQYVIMNVKWLERILDRIYANMPHEIVEARKDKQ